MICYYYHYSICILGNTVVSNSGGSELRCTSSNRNSVGGSALVRIEIQWGFCTISSNGKSAVLRILRSDNIQVRADK